MNIIQKITKNIEFSAVSQIIGAILAFILIIYVARFLGETQFGDYSFAISFTSLFVIFADIGINQLIIREIARDKNLTSEYITNVSLIKIVLSVITFGLIALTINLLDYPQYVIYLVYLFGIYTLLDSFAQIFMSIFQAFERMEYVAIITIVTKIVLTVLALYLLILGYELIELAYAYITVGLIEVVLSVLISIKKIAKPIIKLNFSLWKQLTIRSIPFGLNTLFGMMFFRLDSILLSILKNNTAVGIYSAAYNPLLAIGSMLSTIIISALYPVMSRYYVSSKASLERFTIFSSKYMAIIGFPIAIGSFVLSSKFIGLLYGNQFSQSIIAFQILALFIPIRLISSITGTLLTSINKQGIRTFSVVLSVTFNILLNLILIPCLSYIGASISTVLSEIFLYFLFIYYINQYYHKLRLYTHYLKPFLASIAMGLVLFYLKEVNLFLIIIIAVVIYFAILVLLKTFTNEDINMFKQIIGKN